MLSEEKIKELKQKLLEKKDELESQLEGFAEKDDEVKGNYRTRFPEFGREDEDNVEEFEEYDRSLPLEHVLEEELQEVNTALKKIENEAKYGVCEKCGADIAQERLEARPHAKICMNCAEIKE